MNRRTTIALGIAAFLVFLGVMTFLMMGNRRNRVEVCMKYEGREACKVASGESPQEAIRTATDAACALIAFGVTQTTQCTHSEPASIRRLD